MGFWVLKMVPGHQDQRLIQAPSPPHTHTLSSIFYLPVTDTVPSACPQRGVDCGWTKIQLRGESWLACRTAAGIIAALEMLSSWSLSPRSHVSASFQKKTDSHMNHWEVGRMLCALAARFPQDKFLVDPDLSTACDLKPSFKEKPQDERVLCLQHFRPC